jgi:predicted O-methyltransferase YrrM
VPPGYSENRTCASYAETDRINLREAGDLKLKRYTQLTEALDTMVCEHIVEIGTWNGRRAIELSAAALRNNRAVTYHGFDLFEALTDSDLAAELSKRPPTQAQVKARLRRFQRRVSIAAAVKPWSKRTFDFRLYQGYTRETLPAFRAANPDFRAQLIFIDGGHSIETIRNDWENCSELVDGRGAIFLDDYYEDAHLAERFGCRRLVDDLRGDPRWEIRVLPASDTFTDMGEIRIVRARPL